jgi:hypothetical protein
MFGDLVTFLYARLGEARVRAADPRAVRDVDARTRIVRRCANRANEMDDYPNGLVSPRALLARQILMDLGAVDSDHPDYNPDWA